MGRSDVVTIAVVTYNSATVIRDFLAALPSGLEGVANAEIVVADNASGDGTVGIVRALAPDATLVELGANRGYAAGVNAAVAVARPSDAVLVVNPDIRLGRGAVAALLRALDDPAVGIAAPRITDGAGRLVFSLRRDATLSRAFGEALLGGRRARRWPWASQVVGVESAYERAGTHDWASGACLLVARACLDATGAWDESFFLYSEESEFQRRARASGFSVRYVPEASAVHLGGEAHDDPRLWTLLTLNKLRLYARDHGRVRTALYRAALLCNEALRGGATHRAARRALLQRGAARGAGSE